VAQNIALEARLEAREPVAHWAVSGGTQWVVVTLAPSFKRIELKVGVPKRIDSVYRYLNVYS
jgi:hypothetical protein